MMNIKNIDEWSDRDVENEISRIQRVINEWIISKELLINCGLTSCLECVSRAPESPPTVQCYTQTAA